MTVQTQSQKLARAAWTQIDAHTQGGNIKLDKEYVSFAKKFPSLIHTCGLAQAVTFAFAKKEIAYLDDLTQVLKVCHVELNSPHSLGNLARTSELSQYIRLSRDAITSAGWIKRYVEAVTEDDADA